ncbi:MAG: hypothetical protein RL246_340 [Bacteroidota bacterium]|jgi:hypothetical protein
MRAWILGFCWLFLCACETEVTDFKTQNLSSAIVVSGEMSSLAGPYTVRLNYTSAYSPFDVTEFQGQVIPGADVKILDETGASISLKETQKGVYQTPASFVGQVGKKYKVRILTINGKLIESTLDELKAPLPLSTFSYAFKNAEKVENMRFDLRASLQDKKGSEDFYFIKRQDFIQFLTTCPEPPPPPAPVPVCDCKCWQAPQNTQPILISDFLLDGTSIPLALKPVDYQDLTDVVVQLNVYTVSKEAYMFWKRQEEQRTLGGGLFDKVPAQIIGNLRSVNDPGQQVVGYFLVGGLHRQRLKIDRFNGIPEETNRKLGFYVDFNNIRYKDFPLWDCRKAAWIPYNLGFNLPPM